MSTTNPMPFLRSLIGKEVIVRLKWNKTEYMGILLSTDNYMNFQLDQTKEIIYTKKNGIEQKSSELIGEIFIRCNNVLFIRELNEEDNEISKNGTETKDEDGDSEVVEEVIEGEDVVVEES
ncbi:unnamed protein product [Candida verbasci]|uniref:Sm protein F n=1 Tax=Candida verbasci TaxID=1227364 RepID=A0A9W4XBR3_9ASCO|nr:unnamed protein product [Candida verbasci]